MTAAARPDGAVPHTDRVRSWNDTRTDYPRNALVPDLFEEQARRTPQAVALSPENGADITYAQLLRRVESLAGTLSDRGVRAGDTVAVALERSVDGYVAILGILRAGAVYLPVDLRFPASRIEAILTDAECRFAVTAQEHAHLLPASVTKLDSAEVPEVPEAPARPVPEGVTAMSPAYVLYTSGSAGAPKGVIIPHRGIVRLVRDTTLIGFNPDDVVCGTVNLTFDMSVLDVFGPLLNGARLVVPEKATLLSAAALEELLRREQATVMWLGSALFHQLAAQRPAMFRTLRCLIAGGDALNPTAVREVLAHGRPGQLIDGYGPTENSALSTAHVVDDLAPEDESVPIGTPISNSTAYVVRGDGSLADIGEEGELWVGGDGVALGYLNKPELTAERFVPDRFGDGDRDGDNEGDNEDDGDGGRLYRTGDMARWREDGVIEFLGRRDRQLKLGGFRVELREIEIVLAAHPDVKEAVVAVRGQGTENQRLCGWVVADDGTDLRALPMRLRSYLRDRLPVFMVPQAVDVVEEMPLNAAGKVDRAALSDTVDARDTAPPEEEQPRGATEEAVVEVWQDVLGMSGIRRSEDFFSLGGQSLQATQVAAAISGRLGIAAEHGSALIRSLLANPSAAAFAAQLDALASGAEEGVPATDAGASAPEVDFAHEARVPDTLRFDAPLVDDLLDPDRVLLTGATGFQGVFLIDRLVAAGVPEVWCLVRAKDEEHALRRLAGRMRRYGLDYDKVRDHIVAVPGDVSEPLLGLDADAFDALASSVDSIVHSGSLINFAYPYATLRQTNVEGVRTLLDLATRHRRKPFHHISTVVALVGAGTANVRYLMEDRPLDFPERITLGYAESKWVAEELVSRAAERGLPVSVYRPYEITGTRDRGIWNTDTLMCAWFRTIAETGLAPDVELPLDFVPVDYTAEAIVHIMRNEQPDGRTYNLTNPEDARLDLLVERLRHMGYPVRKVPYSEWVDRVTQLTRDDPHHPMTAFMPMFNDGAAADSMTVKEMYFAETFPEFSRTNTEQATKEAGLDLPPVDASLIDLYLRYFVESGFLTPPTGDPDQGQGEEQREERGEDREQREGQGEEAAAAPAPESSPETGSPTPLPYTRFINGKDPATVDSAPGSIRQVVKELQPNMAAHVRANPLYGVLLEGELTTGHLRRLIAGELHVQPAEIAAFTHLAERFPDTAAGDLFRKVADILRSARPALEAAAESIGIPPDTTGGAQAPSGAQDFAGFISWLSLNTTAGSAAAALRNDLMLWCAMCAELTYALRNSTTEFPAAVVEYVEAYAEAPAQLLTEAAEVVEEAVANGETLATVSHVAQRVDPVLREYWQPDTTE
ncbi:amino acid adenylation domain-containing protein [Streptomyces sp. NPDC050617]|uniref:amino acid adenylation domain-containing protein n=1 Tax=Streptomyces sp. NPDC050617 TaxID=3154628 RepID=UPI003413AC85